MAVEIFEGQKAERLATSLETIANHLENLGNPEAIAEDVTAWLDDNITNPDSPPLDRSLTQAQAAAPADMVGNLKDVIGNKNRLNTDNKTNLVSAINEVNGHFLDGITEGVAEWLDAHPEATTTVQDYSITYKKLVRGTLGFVTPEMYGAKGDGETDDTEAIQAAINTQLPVIFSPKTYIVSATNLDANDSYVALSLLSGTIIIGNGATLKLTANSYEKYRILVLREVSDIFIEGLNIIGDRAEHTGSTGEQGYGISIVGSSNIHIDNCVISYCWGDGIDISATYTMAARSVMTYNVYINNFETHHNRRQGISVEGCDGLYIDNIYIHDISGTPPEAGIDFEPSVYHQGQVDEEKFEYIDNVFATGIRIENTGYASIYFEDKYASKKGRYSIENCNVELFRIIALDQNAEYGSIINISNITICQDTTHSAFLLNLKNANAVVTGNHITIIRNIGDNAKDAITLENAMKGQFWLDDVSIIGPNNGKGLFHYSIYTGQASDTRGIVISNLSVTDKSSYIHTGINDLKSECGAIVKLAKDIIWKNKTTGYVQDLANIYIYDHENANIRFIYPPWIYDGYEFTVINTSNYYVQIEKPTANYPSIYFDDLTTSKTIKIGIGSVKIKFFADVGAWITQEYAGNVTGISV